MKNPATSAKGTLENDDLPERYREPKFTVFEDVMSKEWMADLGKWLHSQRHYFGRSHKDGGIKHSYELPNVDELHQPTADLKKAITEKLDEAIKGVGIPDFSLGHIDCHASLYHHGSHFSWHTDGHDYDGEPVETRRLSYALYLHASPKMFSGGELEFTDGTMLEPGHNRLIVFDPRQKNRVRRVECWSADFLHGRWAIFGWIHSPSL
tara:strand:- start:374 stop:997 length:624 start_codon:yes stop_codon:yes gene_type:complete